MVNRSAKSISTSSRKNKTVWKSKLGKKKTRMVNKRYGVRDGHLIPSSERKFDNSESNEGSSRSREDEIKMGRGGVHKETREDVKNPKDSSMEYKDRDGKLFELCARCMHYHLVSETNPFQLLSPCRFCKCSPDQEPLGDKPKFIEVDNFTTVMEKVIQDKKDKLKSIEEDRKKIYGDPFLSHQAIGLVWEGIFRNRYHSLSDIMQTRTIDTDRFPNPKPGQMFPADLVAEMLAGFKIARLARPTFLQDSADDAKVYISFSERFRK